MAFVSGFHGAVLRSPSVGRATSQCPTVRMISSSNGENGDRVTSAPVFSRRQMFSSTALAAAALIVAPTSALADFTVAQAKRSYDRYFPRIEAGLEQAGEVRQAIIDGDIAKAKALTEEKTFDIKLRRAMSIYATSFSDSSINQQSRSLLACVDGFYDNTAKAVESKTQEESIENWNQAAAAFAAYIRVARLLKLKDTSLEI